MENLSFIVMILFFVVSILLFLFYGSSFRFKIIDVKDDYGYKNNKLIDRDNVPIFRDVPCNKDIYYAYVLIKLNRFEYDNCNLLSAIILKWVKENKIIIRKENKRRIIDLTLKPKFNKDGFEDNLFKMMYEASNNGILETEEFVMWAKNYDMRFLGLFARLETEIINYLKKKFHIYHRITEDECLYDYVLDDKIYQDSVELYGFKKYLEEFSLMEDKEIHDLKLWNEYLMFAALFGISNRVFKQLKKLYPDVEEIDIYDLI